MATVSELTAEELARHLNISELTCHILLNALTELQPDATFTLTVRADGPAFQVAFAYGDYLEVAWEKSGVEVSCFGGLDQYFLFTLHEQIIDPNLALARMAQLDEMRVASDRTLPRMLRHGLEPVGKRFKKLEAGRRGLTARFVDLVRGF